MQRRLKAYEKTTVDPERSQANVRKLLANIGIEDVRTTQTRECLIIEFNYVPTDNDTDLKGVNVLGVRLKADMPDADTFKEREQIKRQYWRVLFYGLKVQLELVSVGSKTFAEAFLPDLLYTHQGKQMRLIEYLGPQIQENVLAGGSELLLTTDHGRKGK